jgi:hypothetical protein
VTYQSATEPAKAVRAPRVSALELTDAAIARIERLDGKINVVVVRDFERARDAAREADDAVPGPLRTVQVATLCRAPRPVTESATPAPEGMRQSDTLTTWQDLGLVPADRSQSRRDCAHERHLQHPAA